MSAEISAGENKLSTERTESDINPIELLEQIKKLIETCRDGQAGYLEAADLARNAELRAFFSSQSMERARFAAELEAVARRMGEANPAYSPSVASMVHRAWIDLKRKLGGGDCGVLGSVEVGERNAVSHYRDALQAALPPEVQTILERQAESISAAYDQVCMLHNMYRNAA